VLAPDALGYVHQVATAFGPEDHVTHVEGITVTPLAIALDPDAEPIDRLPVALNRRVVSHVPGEFCRVGRYVPIDAYSRCAHDDNPSWFASGDLDLSANR
jgi:hypothetical protein